MKSLQCRILEVFSTNFTLQERSCCCDFKEMASIAGNKRRHNTQTLDVKYAALMEIDRGLSNKDVSKKFNVPKNTLSMWKKNREKIIATFKSSGGTKR